jgi:hypothetical protein
MKIYCVEQYGDKVMNSEEVESGQKGSLPSVRYCHSVSLERLRKTTDKQPAR